MTIDDELVTATLAGDATAFATMFDRHAPHVYDHAMSVLRDPSGAAEVTRNTFLAAAHRLGQLGDKTTLRLWLHAVARSHTLSAADPTIHLVADGNDRQHLSGDARDLVWLAAASIDAFDRDILDLHLRQQLDGADLAVVIGCTPEAASRRLDHARAELDRLATPALVVFNARGECNALNVLTFESVGRSTMANVAMHIPSCPVCSARRRSMVGAEALFSAAPPHHLPSELRTEVLASVHLGAVESIGWGTDGFPVPPSPPVDGGHGSAQLAPQSVFDNAKPWIVAGAAAVAALVIALGFLYFVTRGDDNGFPLADGPQTSAPIDSDQSAPTPVPAAEPTPAQIPTVTPVPVPSPGVPPATPAPSGPISESVTIPDDPDGRFADQPPPFISVLVFVCNDPMEAVVEVDSPLPFRVSLEWQWGAQVDSIDLEPVPDLPGRWRGSLATPPGGVSPRLIAESAAGTRTITFADCSV
jgi:RNA polymerase sigma factor (sigma-70 family)